MSKSRGGFSDIIWVSSAGIFLKYRQKQLGESDQAVLAIRVSTAYKDYLVIKTYNLKFDASADHMNHTI